MRFPQQRPDERLAAPGSAPRRAPRGAWARFGILVVILAAGFAVLRFSPLGDYLEVERAIDFLEGLRRYPATPVILVGLWTLSAPLGMPISPLVFAAAVVFGTLWGWVYSMIGGLAGGSLTFFIARGLGRDLVVHWLGETRVRQVEQLVARHAFWTVARIRFVPLPFAIANTGAALSGMRFSTFFFGTAVGLAPVLLVFSYFCHTLIYAAAGERAGAVRNLLLALAAFLALTFLPRLLTRAAPAPPDPED